MICPAILRQNKPGISNTLSYSQTKIKKKPKKKKCPRAHFPFEPRHGNLNKCIIQRHSKHGLAPTPTTSFPCPVSLCRLRHAVLRDPPQCSVLCLRPPTSRHFVFSRLTSKKIYLTARHASFAKPFLFVHGLLL